MSARTALRQCQARLTAELADAVAERDELRRDRDRLAAELARLRRQLAGAYDDHGVRMDASDEES